MFLTKPNETVLFFFFKQPLIIGEGGVSKGYFCFLLGFTVKELYQNHYFIQKALGYFPKSYETTMYIPYRMLTN